MDDERPPSAGPTSDDGWTVAASRSFGLGETTVGYDHLRRPDGERTGYGWVEHTASVAVVARHDGDVLFVEEYRPRLRETVLTCPIGSVEGEESLEAAACRELREETGYEAGCVELLAEHYPVAWLKSRRGVAFADDLTHVGQDLNASEFVEVRRVPVGEALDRALDGEGPQTAWTLLPLLLAREAGVLTR